MSFETLSVLHVKINKTRRNPCHFLAFLECLHSHLSVEWLSLSLGSGNIFKAWWINRKSLVSYKTILLLLLLLLFLKSPLYFYCQIKTWACKKYLRYRKKSERNKRGKEAQVWEKASSPDLWAFSLLPVGQPVRLLFTGSEEVKWLKDTHAGSCAVTSDLSPRCSWTLCRAWSKWGRNSTFLNL